MAAGARRLIVFDIGGGIYGLFVSHHRGSLCADGDGRR